MEDSSRAKVELIREAFYYQSRFNGSTMLFKIDFPVTEEPSFHYLMRDLALLAEIGIRIVIVPGAKERIDAVLHKYGIISSYQNQRRITSVEAIPFVKMAAFDVATRFMTEFAAARINAVIGNFIKARGIGVIDGVDFGHSGRVDRIDSDGLQRLAAQGMVPILPCIGWSTAGKPYNVHNDEIVAAACSALAAVKLFIVSADSGIKASRHRLPASVQPASSGRITRLTPTEAAGIISLNTTDHDDLALANLALALRLSRSGVERVHIVDGRQEGAVLRELFSNLGSGTMVYADEYEAIRPFTVDDTALVLRLMEPLMESGLLLRRTAEDLLEHKDDYVVFEIDDSIHACAALIDWGEGQAELAALAVNPSYADLGLGRRIASFLIDRATKRGFRRVIALTTRTQDWFELLGFKAVSLESLPEGRRRQYDLKRRSQIFALDLYPGPQERMNFDA